jgi:ankyrin repeat protein
MYSTDDKTRLMALGADPSWVNIDQEMRQSIHHAVDRGLPYFVEMLCQNGVKLSCTEARGWTPLHYAVRLGLFM